MSGRSSISFLRIVGSMFMRVNSKCAHQLRPPPAGPVAPDLGGLPESNCGGRLTESGRATIEALPEVVAEVGGSYSGVRRRQRGAAPTCSRRWRSAQKRSVSAVRFCRDSVHSVTLLSNRDLAGRVEARHE